MTGIPNVIDLFAHLLKIMLPQCHFTHAADRIDRRSDLVADIGKEIILALLRIHQRFDNIMDRYVPCRMILQPDIKNVQHTENIAELGKQTPKLFLRQHSERIANNAMIKKNKKQRNKRDPQEFGKTIKSDQNGHRDKSRYDNGNILHIRSIQKDGQLYHNGSDNRSYPIISILTQENTPSGRQFRQHNSRNPCIPPAMNRRNTQIQRIDAV